MVFSVPQRFIKDSDFFTPPTAGGVLAVKYNTIAYTDTTAKNLFTLPVGAVIVDIIVVVKTAFNSSGTDLLDIGDASTGNRFKNDLDVSATGITNTGWVVAELLTPLTADTVITGLFAQSVADASAGSAVVAFVYMQS